MARPKMTEDSPALPEAAVEEEVIDEALMPLAETSEAATSSDFPVASPGGGFRILPLFAGGAVVAALGFGAAVGAYRFVPQVYGVMPAPGTDQRLSDHDKRLKDLAAQLAEMQPGPAGTSAETSAALADQAAAIANLQAGQKDIAAQIADFKARISQLESLPLTQGGAAAANVVAAAQAASQAADAARADAERLQQEARAAARRADLTSALAALAVALENGQPLDPALGKLAALDIVLPPTLTDQAQGVPTLAALRDSFPQAAREALALSLPESAGNSLWGRMTAFLRSQSGARSLTPRAGDDPDAILSRAEAQLGAGDLGAALDEIARLPEAGRTRMAEWAGLAERRRAAQAALIQLQAEAQ